MENYYKLLNVSPTADIDLIRKAFRKKAKSCHPDLFQQLSVEEQKKRQKEFVRLTQAYEILANPQKRQDFDSQLGKFEKKYKQPHKQKNGRSSSFSYGRSSFKRKKEHSVNAQNSSTSNPEDTLEDLLKEVEEMLIKFGLNFGDPLEILVEWARNIYQEITEVVSEQTENSYAREKDNKNTHTVNNRKEPLENIEVELERLKREINSGSKAAFTKNIKYTENEIEEELRSIKKKYRL